MQSGTWSDMNWQLGSAVLARASSTSGGCTLSPAKGVSSSCVYHT